VISSWFFSLQLPLTCPFLKIIQQLLTASFSYSHHFFPSFYLLFNNLFYPRYDQSIYPSIRIPSVRYCPVPLLFVTLLHFSHDRSNWYSPSFCSTTFHNLPGISILLSEISKFQHHRKLCSKGRNLLGYSLNLSQICRLKYSSSC